MEWLNKVAVIILLVLVCWVVIERPLIHELDTSKEEIVIEEIPEHVRSFLDAEVKRHVRGIDVSFYQGEINWQKAGKNVDFVYMKASDGITYQDPKFKEYASGAQSNVSYRGAYHFFEPNDDPVKQAHNFVQTIAGTDLNLTPMLDVEVTREIATKELQQRVLVWLETVEKSLGCKPVLYSNGNFWSTYLGKEFNSYGFWLADYAQQPTVPKGVKNWWLWQYSSKGKVSGIEHSVDLDVLTAGHHTLGNMQCSMHVSKGKADEK